MKQWIVFVCLCFFSPLSGDCGYAVPEGYTPIEPCNQSEALAFWKMLQQRGALIGEKVILTNNKDGTTTIHDQDFFCDLILLGTGLMKEDNPFNSKETFVLYKGHLHNDGHLCYMLECTNSGSGNFDCVLGVWKVIDERIERLSIYDDLASAFFPGNDAHLFYGHHANPFLIEKEGRVFMRWVKGYFPSAPPLEHDPIGLSGIYVYCWEGNTFRYVPSLSEGDDPIVGPNLERQWYMDRFRVCQNNIISPDCEVVASVAFEDLKEFISLQGRSDKTERYPAISLSKEGHFAIKMDQKDSSWWTPLRLQSDVSLDSNNFDKYILYRGDFLNEGRDIFILVKTYNTLMFHDWKDTIWAWEVSEGKLKQLSLNHLSDWIAHPFITKKEGKFRFHFVLKYSTVRYFDIDPDFSFHPSTITCHFQRRKKALSRQE